MKIIINTDINSVQVGDENVQAEFPLDSKEAFHYISKAWLRSGWDNKHVYSFTWLGRPIIQLPEDVLRIQEVIYKIKPDVLIETGVAHGGSLIFYASLFKAIGKGRVVGVDIEIRPHNKKAINEHELSEFITLYEGSSIDLEIVNKIKNEISADNVVMVVLDSNHTKNHVLGELELYAELVSIGSYIVATDGIMGQLVGAPRTQEDWAWNNPEEAAKEFVNNNTNFIIEPPEFAFNEGNIDEMVSYWPNAWVKRIS